MNKMDYIKSHIKKSIFIEAPLSKVWQYAANVGNWQDIHEGLKIVKQISGDGGMSSVYKAEYDMFGKMVPVNIEVQQAELFPEEFIMRAAIRGGHGRSGRRFFRAAKLHGQSGGRRNDVTIWKASRIFLMSIRTKHSTKKLTRKNGMNGATSDRADR